MNLDLAKLTAATGMLGGAISTCLFHTPSISKTALKIVALGALQGAVTQVPSWQITAYFHQDVSFKAIATQLASGAVISAVAMAVMGSTRKEALANFAISTAISWIAIFVV